MVQTMKQGIAEGLIQDQRGQLPGFEKPITSRLEKKLSNREKEQARAYARKMREQRKDAEEKQAEFARLKETLKKEGKL